jgi:hypothetical protein
MEKEAVSRFRKYRLSGTQESVSWAHGQVGWMSRLPASRQEGGNGLQKWSQSRPYNDIFISRKPRPVGGELHIRAIVGMGSFTP